jgi:hypothetical protein
MLKPLVLTSDLVNFCQSGQSIVVASCEADGSPVGGKAFAFRIDSRTQTARLTVPRAANAPLLNAIEQGKGIAVTFSQPTTHKSIQLKAPSARIVSVKPEDKRDAADQRAGFARELLAVGYPEAYVQMFCAHDPRDLAVLTFTPTEAFLQTPGPNAGSAIT